jgi:hypothetical protein
MPGVRIAPQFLVRRAAIELYNEAFGAIECIAWADTDDNPEAVADMERLWSLAVATGGNCS